MSCDWAAAVEAQEAKELANKVSCEMMNQIRLICMVHFSRLTRAIIFCSVKTVFQDFDFN